MMSETKLRAESVTLEDATGTNTKNNGFNVMKMLRGRCADGQRVHEK